MRVSAAARRRTRCSSSDAAPAAMPSRGGVNPRRGISVSSRRGWVPNAAAALGCRRGAPAPLNNVADSASVQKCALEVRRGGSLLTRRERTGGDGGGKCLTSRNPARPTGRPALLAARDVFTAASLTLQDAVRRRASQRRKKSRPPRTSCQATRGGGTWMYASRYEERLTKLVRARSSQATVGRWRLSILSPTHATGRSRRAWPW